MCPVLAAGGSVLYCRPRARQHAGALGKVLLPIAVQTGEIGGYTCLTLSCSRLLDALDLLGATVGGFGGQPVLRTARAIPYIPVIAGGDKTRTLLVCPSDMRRFNHEFEISHVEDCTSERG